MGRLITITAAVLWAASAVAADDPPLTCFAPGQTPAAVIAACTTALGGGLDGRTRALALALRAEAWRETGNAAKARADFDTAVALRPDDPELRLARGMLNEQENRAAEAEADFTAAIAAAASRPEVAG